MLYKRQLGIAVRRGGMQLKRKLTNSQRVIYNRMRKALDVGI